jgi:hypothetical protein
VWAGYPDGAARYLRFNAALVSVGVSLASVLAFEMTVKVCFPSNLKITGSLGALYLTLNDVHKDISSEYL